MKISPDCLSCHKKIRLSELFLIQMGEIPHVYGVEVEIMPKHLQVSVYPAA